ncbi:hypothetical protein, partial [Streptomyces albidoflavus]|uniref:hypothetical protein n=1 Tax=Streptomyces albidoflavus TaxID=1886 RepID=UPI001C93BCE9
MPRWNGRAYAPRPGQAGGRDPARPGPAASRHGGGVIAGLTTSGRPQDPVPAAPDLAQLRAGLDRGLEPEGLYAWFAAQGME